MGGGSGSNGFRQKVGKEGMEDGKQWIALGLAGNNGGTVAQKGLAVEVGIETASSMPEHRLHTIFGILKIDAVMAKMTPDFAKT